MRMIKNNYFVFDLETHLFSMTNMAPKPVCMSWSTGTDNGLVVGLHEIELALQAVLDDSNTILVGHEISYDFSCLLEHCPSLVQKIWQAYDDNRVLDTKIREKLLDISVGKFRGDEDENGNYHRYKYSLAAVVERRFGIKLDKSADGWRLRYAELDGVPIEKWPQEAIDYAVNDSKSTWLVLQAQDEDATKMDYELPTQFDETRAQLALTLMSDWGICTDQEAVKVMWKNICKATQELQIKLLACKLLKPAKKSSKDELPNGVKDTKLIKTLIEQYYPVQDLGAIPHTDPTKKFPDGQIKTGAEVLRECDYEPLQQLIEFDKLRKVASTYLTKLSVPVVHARFDALGAVTTRTSCSAPNLQNPPRAEGVRECFVPRLGHVFIACDYDCQEMRTLAQTCLDLGIYSKLAERFKADPAYDPHIEFAATQLMRISVDEAKQRYKQKDKEVKDFRQRAKAADFGYPGGMGAKKFRIYARTYNVEFTLEEAIEIKNQFFLHLPEMWPYFNHIKTMIGEVGEGTQTYPRSGLRRGRIGYCDGANGYFQGLAAHASKRAEWNVTCKCYTDKNSMLYGSRPVLFLHDEIVIETPEFVCHEAAKELEKTTVDAMNYWTPDIPARATACAMRRWSKKAEATYDALGKLIPWEPSHEKEK